jgi:hypothetical protein
LEALALADCLDAQRAVVTSFHEAGHAVAMYALGMAPGYIIVETNYGQTGLDAQWAVAFQPEIVHPAWVYRRLAVVAMAGIAAQTMVFGVADYPPDAGDLAKLSSYLDAMHAAPTEREQLRSRLGHGARTLMACWWPCVSVLGNALADLATSNDTLTCVMDGGQAMALLQSRSGACHVATWPGA